ncbi:UNVERIFIED_CONTAM: hypothetical protein Slati_2167000 [Sesamum latifolium]|uniref:Integrase catalytic domain-containing protein n=1 Tax=Sesamum latifolium TaxID=2727402 RepID=A0AAW2WSG5_9LAMI
MRHGYFLPTLKRDSMQLVKICAQCQIHGNLHHTSGVKIELAKPTWPFDHWGIDLVGPFPPSQGQKKFLVVAVDHFSKWIEAEPITRITESAMIQFVWRNILCHFGIPRKITSDNGTQFQVSNRIILQNLKTKLGASRSKWVEKVPGVLWAYRTTPRTSTDETPFSLVYGSEALIPAKIVEPTNRMVGYEEQDNDKARQLNLDLVEERRTLARMSLENFKRRVVRNYNSHVKKRNFQVGELVLRKVEVQKPVGKLEQKWEGPYQVKEIRREGTYKLATLEGQEVPRTWSIQNLKKYYS